MNVWYKDRDFPEVKTSNSDIVAVIEYPKQLERVINDHNEVVYKVVELQKTNRVLTETLKEVLHHLQQGVCGTKEEENEKEWLDCDVKLLSYSIAYDVLVCNKLEIMIETALKENKFVKYEDI